MLSNAQQVLSVVSHKINAFNEGHIIARNQALSICDWGQINLRQNGHHSVSHVIGKLSLPLLVLQPLGSQGAMACSAPYK